MIKLTKFILLLLSVFPISNATTSNTTGAPSTANIYRTLQDVSIENYGEPCDPYSPKMPDFKAAGRRISEVKCFEDVWKARYGVKEEERATKCAKLTHINYSGYTAIISGRNANYREFAHMGALGWKGVEEPWVFKCGATLISDKFALTAAHCSRTTRRDPTVSETDPKLVRLGAIDVYDPPNPLYNAAKDVFIKRIIVHPQYKSPRQYYDVALIELMSTVEYQEGIHPACLDSNFETPEKATITGWGVVSVGTYEISPILQVAEVSLVGSAACDSLLQTRQNRKWRGLADHQICAGNLSGGIDTCQGDSGGPLSVEIDISGKHAWKTDKWSLHRIIAVTSFGYGCAQAKSPGIYTRVANFVDWIESIVWPGE